MSKEKKEKGWRSLIAVPTALFIHDYLLEHGEAYPYEIYSALKEKRESLGLYVGSPMNFYKYFYLLKKLGLIEETGKVEKSTSPIFLRKYYRIVPGKEKITDAWLNPQKAWGRRRQKNEK